MQLHTFRLLDAVTLMQKRQTLALTHLVVYYVCSMKCCQFENMIIVCKTLTIICVKVTIDCLAGLN